MNKLFAKLFLGVVIGVFLLVPVGNLIVEAQSAGPIPNTDPVFNNLRQPTPSSDPTSPNSSATAQIPNYVNAPDVAPTPAPVDQKANTQGSQAASGNGKDGVKPQGCFSLGTLGIGAYLNMNACIGQIANVVLWLCAWSLFLAGLILDTSLYFTIHLRDVMQSVPVVKIGWTIFRDLANILFIFILLWTSIATILNLASGKTKEIIVHLIIVGLLMNFSLFMTQAVVDFSNVIAIHFYKQMLPDPNGSSLNPFGGGSFSGAFMQGLKVQTLYNPSGGGGVSSAEGVGAGLGSLVDSLNGTMMDSLRIIFMAFFGGGVMLVASYVFVVGAVLFIIRIVVLMFIMMLSPLAFVSFILPSTEHYGEEWLEKLISQSMFAPIYLSLSYVVVRTIQSTEFQNMMALGHGGAGAGGIFTSAGGLIINFILLIALMLGSILVAKKMEAYGEEFAMEAGSKFIKSALQGKHLSMPFSAAAYGGKFIGKRLESTRFKDFGAKLYSGAEALDKGTDKLRRNIDVNELDKKFKDSAFGATSLGSLIREQTTGRISHAKFGGEESMHESFEENEKLRERQEELEKIQGVRDALGFKNIAEKKLADFTKNPTAQLTGESDPDYQKRLAKQKEELKDGVDDARSNVGTAMNQISNQGFVNMDAHEIEQLIPHATMRQVDAVMDEKGGRWTQDEKKEFLKHRYKDRLGQFDEFKKAQDLYEKEQHEISTAIGEGRVLMDRDGNVVTDASGNAIEIDASKNQTGRKIKIPTAPDIKNYEGLKDWARNEMVTHDWELMNLVNPEAYSNEMLVGTMRWGTIQDLRKNPYFNNEQRKKMRYAKDAGMKKLVDKTDPHYMEENSEAERASAYSIAEAEAKRDRAGIISAVKLKDELKAKIDPKYKRKTSAQLDKEVEKIQKGRWDKTMFKRLTKDVLRERYLEATLRGRAPNEIAGMPSFYRNSESLHRGVGSSVLKQWKDKDTEDVVKILDDLFLSFKEDREGVREMSFQNKTALKWLIEDRDGRSFFSDKISPEMQQIREELMGTGKVEFRSDSDKTGRP